MVGGILNGSRVGVENRLFCCFYFNFVVQEVNTMLIR